MGLSIRFLAATLLSATWLLSVPVASGQSQSRAPAPSRQASSIPDHKLDAAAAAIERVSRLKQLYEKTMTAAAPAEKQRISDEAEGAVAKAISDEGLSSDEYNMILQMAQNNREVRKRLFERFRSAQ